MAMENPPFSIGDTSSNDCFFPLSGQFSGWVYNVRLGPRFCAVGIDVWEESSRNIRVPGRIDGENFLT